MKHTRITTLVLCLAIAVSGCGPKVTTIRHSVGYTDVLGSRAVTVLPPELEVYTVSANGAKERMYDYETHLESVIKERVIAALEKMDFRVMYLDRRDMHDKKLMDYVHGMRSVYRETTNELYKPLLLKEDLAFSVDKSIGPNAIELGNATNSRVFVMVDYLQHTKNNSSRALAFATALLLNAPHATDDMDKSSMIIGFVDARSGKVLWMNMATSAEGDGIFGGNSLQARTKADIRKTDNILSILFKPLQTSLKQ